MKSICSVTDEKNYVLEPHHFLTSSLRKLCIIPQRDTLSLMLYLSPWINWRTLKEACRSRGDLAHMHCLLQKVKYSKEYFPPEICFWRCGFRAKYENRFFRPRTDFFLSNYTHSIGVLDIMIYQNTAPEGWQFPRATAVLHEGWIKPLLLTLHMCIWWHSRVE